MFAVTGAITVVSKHHSIGRQVSLVLRRWLSVMGLSAQAAVLGVAVTVFTAAVVLHAVYSSDADAAAECEAICGPGTNPAGAANRQPVAARLRGQRHSPIGSVVRTCVLL